MIVILAIIITIITITIIVRRARTLRAKAQDERVINTMSFVLGPFSTGAFVVDAA